MLRVAFRHGDGRLFARLVTLVQGGDTAHCELVLGAAGDGPLDLRYCWSSSWLDGGVRRKTMPLHPARWRVYELPDESGLYAAAAHSWFRRHEGARYDWLGLLGFVLRRVTGFPRRWFCSEACAAALGYADPWRFDPATFEAVIARHGRRIS